MAFEKIGLRAVIEGVSLFNRDARLINKRLREVTGNVKKLEAESKGLTASLAQFSPQLKKAGLALTALGAVGGAFIFKATQLAARVETLGVVTETLGKNVGKTKDEIRGLEKAVVDQGITLRAARTSIALMIQSNIDLSNAVNLAAEAQNAAVIAGVDSSEAFRRLVFTITSGNVRMARTLGLQVSFQEAYEKTAASLNKTTLELTQQEKVQARTAEVLRAGTRIVGAYDAAMETAGKKVTSLTRHIENVTVIVGEQFIPIFGDAVDALTAFLKGIEEAGVAQQRGIAATIASTTAVAGLSGVTLLFASQLPGLIVNLKLLGVTLTATTAIVGFFVVALGGLVIAASKARAENAQLRKDVVSLADEVIRNEGSFKDYEDAIVKAAEGTTLWELALRQSRQTGETQREAVLRILQGQEALNEEMFEAARITFRTVTAQDALRGSLRGVGTALADQISDIRLSEISYEDYVKQVNELAKANDLGVFTTKEFTDAVNSGRNPVELLSKSVLVASERQFDLAQAAESSDRAMLRFAGIQGDAQTATETLANKLGITEEKVLALAKAAGISRDELEKLSDKEFQIRVDAVLDERVQENIQFQLDKLDLQISTTVGADFTEFKEELGDLEQTIKDIEIERIEAIAELEAEGIEDVEKLADRIGDLNQRRADEIIRLEELKARLELAREQLQGMGDDTDELARKSKELAIERLINDIKAQERAVAELRGELGELAGGSSELAEQQAADLAALEAEYVEKMGTAREEIEKTTEAWSDQTKEILFNLATQQLGLGGFTGEELALLRTLAGPQGFGLIDEAGVALLETIAALNTTLQGPGNQVPEVTASMDAIASAMIDPTLNAEDLAAAIRDIGDASREVAREQSLIDLIERGLIPAETLPNRQRGGPVRRGAPYRVGETGEEIFIPSQSGIVIPHNLSSALTSFLTSATSAIPIAGAGAPATAAGGGGTTQNYNMTVNTRAPAEQIAADFNLLALMGERRA